MSSFSYSNFCKAIRFTIKGREPRRVFWSYVGFTSLYFVAILIPLGLFYESIPDKLVNICLFVLGLFYLVAVIIGLLAAVRRLHDTGRSGFWVLCYVIFNFVAVVLEKVNGPVGDITALLHFAFWVVMIVFLCQKSDQAANKYGEPVDH